MTVEERRRIALHRAAAETWGEEVADTLVELVAPSGHEIATRDDIQGVLAAMDAMDERWDARITAMDERWDARITAMEQRWDARTTAMEQRWDERLTALEQRWDARTTALDERWDERLTASEDRWSARDAAAGARAESMEDCLTAAFERGLREAITAQTRTLVISQLVAVAVIAGLAFGLGS